MAKNPSFGRRFGRGFGQAFLPAATQTQRDVTGFLLEEARDPLAKAIAMQSAQEQLSKLEEFNLPEQRELRKRESEARIGELTARAERSRKITALGDVDKQDPLFMMAARQVSDDPLAKLGLKPMEDIQASIFDLYTLLKAASTGQRQPPVKPSRVPKKSQATKEDVMKKFGL